MHDSRQTINFAVFKNGHCSDNMQVKKDDISQKIIKEAKKIFLKKGFAKTSMREIAEKSHVGLSNIYNYYANKDEIFCVIVNPVIEEFNTILQMNNNMDKVDVDKQWLPEVAEQTSEEYSRIMIKHRDLLSLLLFKAGGSSLEKFKEQITDKATEITINYMKTMKNNYPELHWDFSPFFIHINAVHIFTLIEEIIMHNIADDEVKQIFMEYTNYHNNGWKDLIYNTKE